MVLKPVVQCILAAGQSRRLGQPKALLKCAGKTLINSHIDQFQGSSIVVLGYAHKELSKSLGSCQFVINENWHLGQFSSLQEVLRAVKPGYDALILPVDQWPINQATYQLLLDSRSKSFDIIQPQLDNKNGHPILISEDFIKKLLILNPTESRLDHIIYKVPQHRKLSVKTQDIAVCRDIDTSEDLHQFRKAHSP